MKDGVCPRCNASEVYRSEVSPRSSDRVTLKEGIVGRDASAVARYVCVGCGYLEYYLPAAEDLEVIRTSWQKVSV